MPAGLEFPVHERPRVRALRRHGRRGATGDGTCSFSVVPGLPAGSAALCAGGRLRALQGRMKQAIHALKYDRLHPAARRLGRMLAEAIAQLAAEAPARDAGGSSAAARSKYAQRGFNQARSLAAHALEFLEQESSRVAAHAGLEHADAAARHREPGWAHAAHAAHECARRVFGFRSGSRRR